jgi:hypothetical protein
MGDERNAREFWLGSHSNRDFWKTENKIEILLYAVALGPVEWRYFVLSVSSLRVLLPLCQWSTFVLLAALRLRVLLQRRWLFVQYIRRPSIQCNVIYNRHVTVSARFEVCLSRSMFSGIRPPSVQNRWRQGECRWTPVLLIPCSALPTRISVSWMFFCHAKLSNPLRSCELHIAVVPTPQILNHVWVPESSVNSYR